jgi:hypothetical protein
LHSNASAFFRNRLECESVNCRFDANVWPLPSTKLNCEAAATLRESFDCLAFDSMDAQKNSETLRRRFPLKGRRTPDRAQARSP